MSKFPVTVTCHTCNKKIDGEVQHELMVIKDTPGFVIFDDGVECDQCVEKRTGMSPNTLVTTEKYY